MHPPPAWPADFSMVVPNSFFNLASMILILILMIIYHQFQDSYSRTKTTYASQMRVWKSFWQFPLRQPTRTLSRSRILFFFRYVNNDWVVANHKQVWVDWFLLCPIVRRLSGHVNVAMVPSEATAIRYEFNYGSAEKPAWPAKKCVYSSERPVLERRCCSNVYKISFVAMWISLT